MPWDVQCTYAEVLHIKLPIQLNDLSLRPSPLRFFSCITKHFYPNEDLITKEAEFFTAPFEKDRLDLFYVRDKDVFFTASMRSRMASCLVGVASGHSQLLYYCIFIWLGVNVLCSEDESNSC